MTQLSRPYDRVASNLYRYLNTALSLSAYIALKYKQWDRLATMAVDPRNYLDTPSGAEKYRRDSQAANFLRKSESLPSSFDKKKAALDSFRQCEKQCAETNYFLELLQLRQFHPNSAERALQENLEKARKIVKRILGPLPEALTGRFGPGTSFELQGSTFSTLADKLWITPHVTQAAEAVWRHTVDDVIFTRRRLELGLPYLAYARGNRFTTVPKTSVTDRGICVEPLGNLFCQLGVGSYLKEKLASVGLYVQRSNTPLCPIKELSFVPRPEGQRIHRGLAEMASRDGSWATIDLSNASDTVAFQLVKALLPHDWFMLLDSLRSPFTRLPGKQGKWVRLEKFSSMGNGYTFELETLIFAALSSAVAGLKLGEQLFVYGDDIIVPSSASRNVLAILRATGFTPNQGKTFTSGPFRESCGGDFFSGFDVRSVYSKAEPSNPMEWVALHNRLRAKWPGARHVFRHIVEQVPTRFRLFGPSRAGDVVFHASDSSKWRVKLENSIRWLRCLKGRHRAISLARWGGQFDISLALLGVASTGLVPRGTETLLEVDVTSIS